MVLISNGNKFCERARNCRSNGKRMGILSLTFLPTSNRKQFWEEPSLSLSFFLFLSHSFTFYMFFFLSVHIELTYNIYSLFITFYLYSSSLSLSIFAFIFSSSLSLYLSLYQLLFLDFLLVDSVKFSPKNLFNFS